MPSQICNVEMVDRSVESGSSDNLVGCACPSVTLAHRTSRPKRTVAIGTAIASCARVLGRGIGVLGATIALVSGCDDRPAIAICPGPVGIAITRHRVERVDKVDLLFVIDNSPSMADKQRALATQLPEMLARLTTADVKRPITDVHVGVITSSLGSHGTSACATSLTNPTNNDRGHLLPRTGDCATSVAASPLGWTFGGPIDALATNAQCVLDSVGEHGCSFEETWESLYHFVIDPAPYARAEVKCNLGGPTGDACGNNKIVVDGVDEELLAQRRAFLRPESFLAVVILSDENDASLKPAGLNWLPWGYPQRQMQRGWTACATVPDDFEPETPTDFAKLHDEHKCFSCFEKGDDPNCKVPWPTGSLNDDVDAPSLRAFEQTRRYGYNFLWGRQRYVDAFTKWMVMGSDNQLAPNPVLNGAYRTRDLILVATIVGVPPPLVPSNALTDADWDRIVGPIGTRDPHMIESIAPRAGLPKYEGDRSVDPIHGGDRDIPTGNDLQYACIAKRTEPGGNGDCQGIDPTTNPVCAADSSQPYLKAYPGLRHLRIARELGISGYVASICAESYRPAVVGLVDKILARVNAQCVHSSLNVDPGGRTRCLLIESMQDGVDGGKRCEELGRGLCTPGAELCRARGGPFPPVAVDEAAAQLNLPITVVTDSGPRPSQTQATTENGNVYVVGNDGRKHLVCELQQFSGDTHRACATDPDFSVDVTKIGGWCYSTDPAIVGEECRKIGAPQTLRFFGGAEPRRGSEVFPYCASGGGC